MHTLRELKFAILALLSGALGGKLNKVNVLGRPDQAGALEAHLGVVFRDEDRALAYRAFGQLHANGLIQPTLDDLIAPESWFVITARGTTAWESRALDKLDECLMSLSANLVEMRAGAWSAIASNEPDSLRQAAHSGRELIDQVLKIAAPDESVARERDFVRDPTSASGFTRRQRLRYIMRSYRRSESDSELRVAERACDLVLAIDDRLKALAHSRGLPPRSDVEDAMLGAEIALRRILIKEAGDV